MQKYIIFSDLDGTLLDSRTYSFKDANPALRLIRQRDVPLVLCSSKTWEEIEVYRSRLLNKDPFVAENGGGVFIPEEYFPFPVKGEIRAGYHLISFGRPYQELRSVLEELREELSIGVRGFGDMSAQEVAVLTGLAESEASLAKMRDFDEPFIFEENDEKADIFLHAIESRGYHWTKGRFHHVTGRNDKGRAVAFLRGLYEKKYGSLQTIGIGDNLNDLPLLQAVDHPVLVQNEFGAYEKGISVPKLVRAEGIGPRGWNSAIIGLLGI